jgi:hypothetical protein
MKDIREALGLIFVWLMIAGYVLLALLLFAHILFALISQWRSAVWSGKGPVDTGRPDQQPNLISEAKVQGMTGGGRHVRPWTARIAARPLRERAGVKAQTADSVAGESGTAW